MKIRIDEHITQVLDERANSVDNYKHMLYYLHRLLMKKDVKNIIFNDVNNEN